jgi:hypothetical protein
MSTQLSISLDLFDAISEPEPSQAAASVPEREARIALAQPPRTQMHPAMREVLGDTLSSALESVFHLIEIAEEMIKEYVKRYPSHASRLNQAFMALQWHLESPVRDELYRAHSMELLQRVVDGKGLEEGTRAEVLIALSGGSVRGPLVPQYAALFEKLFLEIFGPDALPGSEPLLHEPWQGASEELLNELRRRIRVPSRQLQAR